MWALLTTGRQDLSPVPLEEAPGRYNLHLQPDFRGRPGFDVGAESEQGMPSTSSLVNPLETNQLRTTNVSLSPLNTGEPLNGRPMGRARKG
jgi:hypothetical protein